MEEPNIYIYIFRYFYYFLYSFKTLHIWSFLLEFSILYLIFIYVSLKHCHILQVPKCVCAHLLECLPAPTEVPGTEVYNWHFKL